MNRAFGPVAGFIFSHSMNILNISSQSVLVLSGHPAAFNSYTQVVLFIQYIPFPLSVWSEWAVKIGFTLLVTVINIFGVVRSLFTDYLSFLKERHGSQECQHSFY